MYPLVDLPALPAGVNMDLYGRASDLLSVRWRLPVDVAGAALADTAREMGVEVDALSQLVVGSLQQTTDPLTSSP